MVSRGMERMGKENMMKYGIGYKSMIDDYEVVSIPSHFRLFGTRGYSFSDEEMAVWGIEKIVNGSVRLNLWVDDVNDVLNQMRNLMWTLIRGYEDYYHCMMLEGKKIKGDTLYNASMVLFKGVVERDLFILKNYNDASGPFKRHIRPGMLSMMN